VREPLRFCHEKVLHGRYYKVGDDLPKDHPPRPIQLRELLLAEMSLKPPPHVHGREEEGFYILEGQIAFQIGGERIVATTGMFANVPVGTPHSLKNESDKPAKMLISIAPAGLEQMFFEIGVSVAQGATTAPPPTKAEIEKLFAIAPQYGIEILLPH
jgi:mannose-6-phosphate isomerase-like protein (cupin superfamily)